MKILSVILSLTAFFFCLPVNSETLGSIGEVYPLDDDGREQFKGLARKKQESGAVDTFWKEYRDKVIASINNPTPLGIKVDYSIDTEYHNPIFVLPNDYTDVNGTIIASKGTRIEPLKLLPLRSGLLFIDGRDISQVEYAVSMIKKLPFLKITLTAGSPIQLRKQYSVPFYFDQRKMIISQLENVYGISIRSVPAAMYQKNDALVIEYGMAK